jgi:hypothetical protein
MLIELAILSNYKDLVDNANEEQSSETPGFLTYKINI